MMAVRCGIIAALLIASGTTWAGAVCEDLWLSPSCAPGACSHHVGVWAWCECPGMEGRNNYIEQCPQGVAVPAASGHLVGALTSTIAENPGVLMPCAQFDEASRPACRAALLVGGAALGLGVHAAVTSGTEECQVALAYANQELRRRHQIAKAELPRLVAERTAEQERLMACEDDSGFKGSPYRSLLAELLRDDLEISQAELARFDDAHPGFEGGAVAAYRAHRGSPFFDQMIEVFRINVEIARTKNELEQIGEVFPLNTSAEAARDLARSGACDFWVRFREDNL